VSLERRYERLHPDELDARQGEAPVAFAPLGPMEFHGPHLPAGVDAIQAHGLCLRAAERAGGVVLPPSYIASGCLDLPFTLDFEPDLVHRWARAVLSQLARRGWRVVVLLTGHGPLDLIHLLKRACAEAEIEHPGLRAYGLCWLELNAARAEGPDRGEPTVVDHAALVETSWMLHLAPELVEVERLAADPEAAHIGVYGRNPRFTASREFGAAQVEAAAELLGERVRLLLGGGALDPLADLRRFVDLSWPEPLEVTGSSGGASEAALLIANPGRASRYLSGLDVRIDGEALDASGIVLVNASAGEVGAPVPAAALGRERGFYIRRGQVATAALGSPVTEGTHSVVVDLDLGGVTRATIAREIPFTPRGP